MQGVKDPTTQRGIIPRSFEHIFETVSIAENTKFLIRASYLEIYNEEIHDLLGKDTKLSMSLKEHPEKGVYVQGLSYHTVQNVEDCRKIMEKGWHNRTTGATLMNKDSSRSHSIFTIQLEMITKKDSDEEHIRAGKLNLVDLAGSERQVKTGASGDRLKEASKINLSLSALGNVISALVNSKVKHIPYRDSRLTRLLQDSLGGNTKTLMVACLSPADNNYDETLSTLRYANRAKNIKNKPKINEDPKDVLLREYQEEITKLKALLMGQNQLTKDINQVQKENEKQTGKSSSPGNLVRKEELEKEKENLKREYEMHFSEIQAKYEEERNNRAKLQEDMTKLQDFYESKLSFVDGQIAELPTDQDLPEKGALEDQNVTSLTEEEVVSSDLDNIENVAEEQETDKNNLVTVDNSNVQQEAMKRLLVLQQQMVGGENVNNKEVKERRKKKMKFAEERKRKLAEAVANMDDDYIMIDIYENIHDELRAVTKKLGKAQKKVVQLESEFSDIQSEFEVERIEYIQTIQKQEKQVQLFQAILDQIQPCLRRDSNYFNLDKIKNEAHWDEDNQKWILPKVALEKTTMPFVETVNNSAGQKIPEQQGSTGYNSSNLSKAEDDKLREKLWKNDNTTNYFYQMRRSNQLISDQANRMSVSQIKESFSSSGNFMNMQHQHSVPLVPGGSFTSSEVQLEPTHKSSPICGPLSTNSDTAADATIRKPLRLEALNINQSHGRKSKKKKNSYNMFE
ncbi:kinesin-like protein KIF17 [Octopus bimaculoides]|nr:kinesin-like protein KIF17 [Octopus bimaculoides]